MQVVCFDEGKVGVIDGDRVRDISAVIGGRWRGTPHAMNELIRSWDAVAADVRTLSETGPSVALAQARLTAPLPSPRHLFAAPLNYRTHVAEMVGSRHAPPALRPNQTSRNLGFFLKAPGSICGPLDAVELPSLPTREFHHEVELGVVIGREARGIAVDDAHEYIFGYVCLLDITMRTDGDRQEERVMRKSFETFTPIGPWIVTTDEIPDSGALDLRLWVNEELRQSANTRDLIVPVDDLVSSASHVVSLSPGDIYATGTPDGVGPIVVGDTIRASIESVGELQLPVVQRSW
jgi:2-keto-4-pentenoate hydratase/2-oxohepta-3-ene-1,7-dioic acid hydratase in catechol pathway